MKLICNGNDLAEAVSKVSKAASTRSTSPVLEGIKIKAEKGTLTLLATDLELAIEKSIVADVKIEGETVVPGKFFSEFVKKLTREEIELSLDENNRLKIKYLDSAGELMCYDASEYPVIKDLSEGQSFIIIRSELKDLINKTAFSVSMDDARPMLKGVLFEVDETTLTAVALDGYRLARCRKPIERTSALMRAIVPARCVTEIARLLDDSADAVTITIQKNYLKVDLEHTKIITRLLDGDFINYKQIIPSDFRSVMTLPCSQFEDGLERAVLLSRVEKNNLVKFEVTDGLLTLVSNSDIGNVKEKIPVKLNGDDLTIAFNARYFMEILKYVGTENLVVKFTNSVSPCVIEPSGSNDELLYLVLPVRIS